MLLMACSWPWRMCLSRAVRQQKAAYRRNPGDSLFGSATGKQCVAKGRVAGVPCLSLSQINCGSKVISCDRCKGRYVSRCLSQAFRFVSRFTTEGNT